MKTYIVYGTAHVAVFLEVRAASPEDARAKAETAGLPRLCHQCGHGGREVWGLSDGLGEFVEIAEDAIEEIP